MEYYFSENNNCLQCCVAGMFNRTLDKVPDVIEFKNKALLDLDSKNWFDAFYIWCKQSLGHIPVVFAERELDDTLDDVIHLEVYESDEGITHAAIVKGEDIIWDPMYGNPQGERKALYRIIFLPIYVENGINHEQPIESGKSRG
jgi:hypothetical protein